MVCGSARPRPCAPGFLDETWTATNMARLRGTLTAWRAAALARAARPLEDHDAGRRPAPVRDRRAVRARRADQPDAFLAYVDQVLVPELSPGDIVVMDNLGSHKGPAVRAAIEAAGARLLVPPALQPGFQPDRSFDKLQDEVAFSKLKALLRKAAERTVEGLWSAIGRLVDAVTPDECANFFAAAGYEPD